MVAMEIDQHFAGFRAAMGDTVPDDHFLARVIDRVPEYAKWLDRRYQRVFLNGRFEVESARRDRITRQLASTMEFAPSDAEVQAAATILRNDKARVQARAEATARAADYLVVLEREIDVEVRLLREDEGEREVDAVLGSIQKRLEAAALPSDLLLAVHVYQVRREGQTGRLLDSSAEAQLVRNVRAAASSEPWRTQPVQITVAADGYVSRSTPNSSRSGELASVTFKYCPALSRCFVLGTSQLQELTEEDRVYTASGGRKGRPYGAERKQILRFAQDDTR